MRPKPRQIFGLFLVALAVLAVRSYDSSPASAAIGSVTASPNPVILPSTTTITVPANETGVGGEIRVIVGFGEGLLAFNNCSIATAPTACPGGVTATPFGAGGLIIDNVDNATAPPNDAVTLTLEWLPPTTGIFTVSACQGTGCTPLDTGLKITVNPPAALPSEDFNPHISLTSSSEVINCDQGSVTLTAVALNDAGVVVPAAFEFHTNYGTIVQIDGNHAQLQLPISVTPSSPLTGLPSTVRATAFGFGSEAISIQVRCFVSVVVTANPNVVSCGGQSLITATVRDHLGHVLVGVGFHFATDSGLLIVGPPNSASAEQASAILQLFPPGSNGGPPASKNDPSSTNPSDPTSTSKVTVSVGTLLGTVEQTVTVQQYCPSSEQVAGAIALNSSVANVGCGGSAFVAGTLKDIRGNPVPDGTELKFLASSGNVGELAVSDNSASGTPTPPSSPSVLAKTKGGTANIVYTAAFNTSGPVTITAASGASFGSITLQVCGAGGVGGTGVRPPNTGTGIILPPNTGDGGMR